MLLYSLLAWCSIGYDNVVVRPGMSRSSFAADDRRKVWPTLADVGAFSSAGMFDGGGCYWACRRQRRLMCCLGYSQSFGERHLLSYVSLHCHRTPPK